MIFVRFLKEDFLAVQFSVAVGYSLDKFGEILVEIRDNIF